MDRNDVVQEALRSLAVLERLKPVALAEAENASKRGGDITAAQRLWSLTLAAAEKRCYADLIDDHDAAVGMLWDVAARLRKYIIQEVTPDSGASRLLARSLRRDRGWFPPWLERLRRYVNPADGRGMSRFLLCLRYLPPSNRFLSHLHLVCCYAAALASMPGTESVLIMATGESAPPNLVKDLHAYFEGDYADAWRAALRSVASPEIYTKVMFYDGQTSEPVSPIAEAVDAAAQFEPDVIVYFQGLLRSLLMPEILKDVAPQVAVQFQVTHPEPEHCDLVLSLLPDGGATDFRDKPTPRLWASHVVPILPLASENEGEPAPAIPEAAVRIVTALSHGRIEFVLLAHPSLAGQIAQFLEETPGAAWVFVGIMSATALTDRYPRWRELVEAGRILLTGHTRRLREVFAGCDLYVHPPGFGGGAGGVAMAIAEGLPVVVEAGTDSANFVGDEGLFGNQEEAFGLVGALALDEAARRSLAARQAKALEAGHSIDATARRLRDLLPRAAQNFALRRKAV